MAQTQYQPLIADVRMSDHGYWVVTISVTPWQRMSVMICQVGISPQEAETYALSTVSPVLPSLDGGAV
jgi:hypothetical protein